MGAIITTRPAPEVSSRFKAKMVGGFYLLTLLIGGFFFLAGSKVGFIADLTAGMFYIAATALFYAANKDIKNRL